MEIDAARLQALGLETGRSGRVPLFYGKGCQKCRGTGYLGRTTIHEVLPYSDAIKSLTLPDADLVRLTETARAEGMASLRESAVGKLLDGTTTYQEVLRVTSSGDLW
jgi:general secretion pathway protein E